jgi:hypothetical protein
VQSGTGVRARFYERLKVIRKLKKDKAFEIFEEKCKGSCD